MGFIMIKCLVEQWVAAHLVELRPLTVVIIVAACERTKGVPWVLQEYIPRADVGFCKNMYQGHTLGFGDVTSKGRPWVFGKLYSCTDKSQE